MAAAAAAIAAVRRNQGEGGHGKTDIELMQEIQAESDSQQDTTFTDPELHPKYRLYLSTWTALSIELVNGKYESTWSTLVLVAIITAGILVGVQTYPFLETAAWVVGIDMCVLVIFVLEVLVKIGVEGVRPWRYLTGPDYKWNIFDFVIVLFCIPLPESVMGSGASIAPVLRLFRLARLMKLIKKVPQLQMIVMGLIGGLRSIGYISLLLVLIFYLFAILGVSMFRATDPWHWKTVPIAFMTLFRAATLEDWTDLMYINIYGCNHYGGGIYHSGVTLYDAERYGQNSSSVFSIVNTHNDRYHCAKMGYNESGVAPVSKFVESSPLGDALVVLYFVLFITISALVMLSLFVGSVTMSMSESMAQMKSEHEEQDRKRRMMKMMKAAQARPSVTEESDVTMPGNGTIKKAERERMRATREMRQILAELVEINGESAEDDLTTFPNTLGGKYQRLALKCDDLANDSNFGYFIMFVIVFAGILVGVETNIEEPTAKQQSIFALLDWVITCVFIFEILVKVVAEEFEPLRFFKSNWNTFDLLVVGCSFIPSIGDLAVILRLLRLLRVLKLIKSMPQLAVIVNALVMGVSSIGFISAILVLFFYVFAIVGIFFFRDNDPMHFGNLFIAMLTLFRMATFEDWTDVMYINFYGCDKYGYTDDQWMVDKCTKPHASTYTAMLYSFVFVLIGGLVLLTLFIGVVTTSMEEATEQQRQAEEVTQRVLNVAKREKLDTGAVDKLKLVFNKLDLDGGGTIEEDELRHGLRQVGREIPHDVMAELMDKVDTDKSGSIDFAEFVEFVVLLKNNGVALDGSRVSTPECETSVEDLDASKLDEAHKHKPDEHVVVIDQGASPPPRKMQGAGFLGLGAGSSSKIHPSPEEAKEAECAPVPDSTTPVTAVVTSLPKSHSASTTPTPASASASSPASAPGTAPSEASESAAGSTASPPPETVADKQAQGSGTLEVLEIEKETIKLDP